MGNELKAALLLSCKADIVVVHIADTVGKNLLRSNIKTESVNGNDDELEERVPTVNIERWVTLGKAQILCKFEGCRV